MRASPTSHEALLADLEEAVAASSASKQAAIARQVTSLFLSGDTITDEQIELFEEVLAHLIDKIETRALIELGERLAEIERAPAKIMERLASHDEILIAGPVLSKYADLDDASLCNVCEVKSQAHLLAVAARRTIREPVTDVLVRRGDAAVALNVARNAGAQFSEFGYQTLSQRAATDKALAESIALRVDVPSHIFVQLLVQASKNVQERMLAGARPEMHAEIKSVLDQIGGQLADELPVKHRYDVVTRELLLKYPDGKIGEQELLEIAQTENYDGVVGALSLASSLSLTKIVQLLSDTRPEPIVFLCKALGYAWSTVQIILQSRPAMRMSAHAMVKASEAFERVSTQNAQLIVGFWRHESVA